MNCSSDVHAFENDEIGTNSNKNIHFFSKMPGCLTLVWCQIIDTPSDIVEEDKQFG